MRISEVVCESALFLKEPSSFRENQEVQAIIKKMDNRMKIRRFRLTENKHGGSRGALEERLTKWLAQPLKGFSCLCIFIFSFLSLFMLCWENQSKPSKYVDTFDNPGCQLVPWYVVATIFAKIHRARALDLHCSLLHLATCVQVVN